MPASGGPRRGARDQFPVGTGCWHQFFKILSGQLYAMRQEYESAQNLRHFLGDGVVHFYGTR